MSRYIDAELLEPDTEWDDYEDGYISYSEYQIKCAKTADVRENVKGKWRIEYTGDGWNDYIDVTCTNCGKTIKRGEPYNFCPNCGADMRGEA